MDGIIVNDIIEYLEEKAPKSLAMSYDNVGLLVGDQYQSVNKVMVGIEVTESLIQEAIDHECELIVVHHPLIFSPIKTIVEDNPLGRKIRALIKANISVYVAHTNIDVSQNGLNDYICQVLEWDQEKVLKQEERFHTDERLMRICSVQEQSLYDVLLHVKKQLVLKDICYVGARDKRVKRIAICTGNGMSFLDEAIEQKVDAFLTGDVRYHDAVKAQEYGIALIDAGHYGTEIISCQLFENMLVEKFGQDLQIKQQRDFLNPMETL